MRGTKAKRFRKQVYKDSNYRDRHYFREYQKDDENQSWITADALRQQYQQLKKKGR